MNANQSWKQLLLCAYCVFTCIFFSSCSHRSALSRSQSSALSQTPAIRSEPKFFPPKIPLIAPERPKAALKAPYLKVPSNPKSLIVLDPGHGGKDMGTYSEGSHVYHEKFLNLSTANMVQTYLKQMGYAVVMTRSDDTFIGLAERAEFANGKKPMLFVSIHYNSAPSLEAEGIEIFYYRSKTDKKRTEDSKLLATVILQKILKNTDAKSRGVKHGDLAVIRQTEMPAVLVEGGFLTNKGEREKLADGAYLKRLALGIAQGIDAYAQTK